MTRDALFLADPAATERIGHALGEVMRPGDVVLLGGDLGAGKTSLARGILHALGVAGEVPSPSFALVLAYTPPEVRLPVLHADLYRLDAPADVTELGLDEAADGVLLLEWPERVLADRWPDALRLCLTADGAGRRLTWATPAWWEGRWPPPR